MTHETNVTYPILAGHWKILGPVSGRESTAMSQKLLDVLTLGHCSHEFSWPRRSADGHYYQVCLHCASAYNYDWKAMRRTKRVDPSAEAEISPTQRKWGQGRKPTWVPRARRLKLQAPLRYRAKYQTTWYEGTIENLSQSGVFFRV